MALPDWSNIPKKIVLYKMSGIVAVIDLTETILLYWLMKLYFAWEAAAFHKHRLIPTLKGTDNILYEHIPAVGVYI